MSPDPDPQEAAGSVPATPEKAAASSGTGSGPGVIDARGPRFNQGVLAVALLAGYVVQVRAIYAVWGVVLLLSAAGGARFGPFLRLYRDVIAPRLGPPGVVEDPRPPRFAAAVGTAFLAGAAIALAAGIPGVADGLALVVAGLAALAAVSGLCVGCEVYVWITRRTSARPRDVPSADAVP